MPRMMSMEKDPSEVAKLVWGRYKNFGSVVCSEFGQPCPFFFTREKWPLQLVGNYRGWSAFLICSGPSFATMDKTPLTRPGVWTMTTNNAVASWRGNASVIVDDPARFVMSMWMDPTIMKFIPADQFEKPLWDNRRLKTPDGKIENRWEPCNLRAGDSPNVVGFHRNYKFAPWRWLYEDTINWGDPPRQGGNRSVMLAALRILHLIGFRRVYILGADFNMDKNSKYSFDEERTKNAIKNNTSTYLKLQERFAQLQPYFLAEDFIVKNCTPGSKLDVFPMCTLEEAVEEATAMMGDVANERTNGMYVDFDKKLMAYNEMTAASGQLPVEPPPRQNSRNLTDDRPLGRPEIIHDAPAKRRRQRRKSKPKEVAMFVPSPVDPPVDPPVAPPVVQEVKQDDVPTPPHSLAQPPPALLRQLEERRREERKKIKQRQEEIDAKRAARQNSRKNG